MAIEHYYAGIDLHKKYSYVTIMDQSGIIHNRSRHEHTTQTLIPQLLSYNTDTRRIKATVESTYGWYWLADSLDAAGIDYCLAHPAKVKAVVGKKKTDKEDAKALAHLLRTHLLPMSYIPTPDERSIRELLRFRMTLVSQRSTIKRRLRDILAKQNKDCPYDDILGKQATSWLRGLACPQPYALEIETALTVTAKQTEEIEKVIDEIRKRAVLNDTCALS